MVEQESFAQEYTDTARAVLKAKGYPRYVPRHIKMAKNLKFQEVAEIYNFERELRVLCEAYAEKLTYMELIGMLAIMKAMIEAEAVEQFREVRAYESGGE